MKVLYVVPNWKKHETKHTSVSLYAPKSIPLEYMYVKQLLNKDIESKIIDANSLELEWDKLHEEIKEYSPDVIIFNTTLNYILWRCPPVELEIPKKLMNLCENINATTIAIGPHAVVDPDEVYEELGVDYMIVGEPELALAQFLNSNLKDLTVKGLYGKEVNNGVANEVDMRLLPTPDFDLVDISRYEPHVWSSPTTKMMAEKNIKGTILEYSRGCIYHCPYCFRKGFREKFRVKPIEIIEKEILEVKKRGIRYIYFIDEIFNIDSDDWRKLLAILKRENMYFGCQARPDIMTYEQIDLLKESGCIYIEYGVESLSEEVLKAIKKNLNLDHVKKVIVYSYQVFGKENVEPGWINFYTKDIKTILGLKEEGKWLLKVVRPYPNSFIGDKICEMYNVTNKKWNFVLRYLWWSQIENYESYFRKNSSLDPEIKNTILFGEFNESKELSYKLIEDYVEKIFSQKRKGC